ncbi:hypothetical protein SARC_06079, partial [Sphaeroforma arctica JP610]
PEFPKHWRVCIEGKLKRKAVPHHTSDTIYGPVKQIDTDLQRPMPADRYGNKYTLNMICDGTKFGLHSVLITQPKKQARHDFHGIWNLHKHIESFLQHVEQPPYSHPSLTN